MCRAKLTSLVCCEMLLNRATAIVWFVWFVWFGLFGLFAAII
jgi:hypothetical protein